MAVSHRKGRALPVWCQVNLSQAALIKPLLVALEEFFAVFQPVSNAVRLTLVMDRWFASGTLLSLFESHSVYFIARSKGDKLVQLAYDPSWWREPLGDISNEELAITYRDMCLRFVRSNWNESMKDDEPWFLLTNLPDRKTDSKRGYSRQQILNRYAERFEIEELLKDIKWLQRLEWQQIRKPQVIESLMHFIFLGWWLLWKLEGKWLLKRHKRPKQQLSWFRTAWERLQYLSRPEELRFVT